MAGKKKALESLALMSASLKEEGIFVSTLAVDSAEFLDGAIIVTQTLLGSGLPPNVLFIKLGLNQEKDHAIKDLIIKAQTMGLGIMIFRLHPKSVFGQKQEVNIWIRKMSPNINLTILIGLQLERNWEGKLRLIQVVADANEQQEAQSYLYKLKKLMRFTRETEIIVVTGSFEEAILNAPLADINIFGISKEHDVQWMRKISDKVNTSALFLKDSEQENAVM